MLLYVFICLHMSLLKSYMAIVQKGLMRLVPCFARMPEPQYSHSRVASHHFRLYWGFKDASPSTFKQTHMAGEAA